jgi:hypothetical protein
MWKPVGVVGLWLVLLVVPHLGSHAVHVSPTGVQVAATVPTEDPGDPSLEPPGAQDAHHKARQPSREKAEPANALVTIRFKNALDKTLTLANATLVMDGEPLAPITSLGPQANNVVFTGRMTPGSHTVTTHLTCVGRKRGAVFTYLKDFRWEVSSEQTLTVLPNRSMVFTISAVRRKGMNVPVEKQVEVSVYNELLPEPTTSLRN